jgi:hypothetical protein
MRQPTLRRKLIPVTVNVTAIVARPVSVIISDAGAHHRRVVSRSVIVGIRGLVIIVRISGVIASRIIPGVIRRHIWSLCTSSQESCYEACAKNRQQYWSATLGFDYRFHQIPPFSILIPSCPKLHPQPELPSCSLRQESRRSARCFHCTIRTRGLDRLPHVAKSPDLLACCAETFALR